MRRNYMQEVPGIWDQLASTLYDYRYIGAVPECQRLFDVPIGAPDPATGEILTRLDTSMVHAGYLPRGQAFIATGIRVVFIPDARLHRGRKQEDEQDAKRVLLGGQLRLFINNRDYLNDAPLAKFPACYPKTWMAELAYLSAEDEEPRWRLLYDPQLPRIAGMAYYKMTPLHIQENQYFGVNITHEAQPLNAPGRLGAILDGRLLRMAQ